MMKSIKTYIHYDMYKLHETNGMSLTTNRIIRALHRQGKDLFIKDKYFIFTHKGRVFLVSDHKDEYFNPTNLTQFEIITMVDGGEETQNYGTYNQFSFLHNLDLLENHLRELKCDIDKIALTNYTLLVGVPQLEDRRKKKVFKCKIKPKTKKTGLGLFKD